MEKNNYGELENMASEKKDAEKIKWGANIMLSVELIRHPEKDPVSGDITLDGKNKFGNKLREEYDESFDAYKFYLSPHKRSQQTKGVVHSFLDGKNIPTTIRNKNELLGRMTEYTPQAKNALFEELKHRGLLEEKLVKETKEDTPSYEPGSVDLEKIGNKLLIEEFFDKKFPEFHLSGKDIGKEIKKLINHFSKLAARLKSDSRVKIILVGHSGVIEYFNKLVYLKNHPELKAEEVHLEEIGGLMDPLDGPMIEIRSDEKGDQTTELSFKDLKLEL